MTQTQSNARDQRTNRRAAGGFATLKRWALTLSDHWSATEFFDPPPRREWPVWLRRVRFIGLVVLAIELLIFCWWSSVMASRFAMTTDFAGYYQPTFLIAHSHLNPFSTIWNFSFWRNDGEFVFWALAIPVRIWMHFETLKWMQALALVAGQAIAFGWICEIAAKHAVDRRENAAPIALAAVGLLMLVANPWFVWSVSFDVHSEAFAVPFVIAAARDSYRGRLARAWIWAVLAIACGAVSTSYISAIGLSLIISGRRWWRHGAALAVAGLVWQMLLRGVGATGGSDVAGLYWQFFITNQHTLPKHASLPKLVVSVLGRPHLAATTLWGNRASIWASTSPPGLIGVFWLPALVPALLVLVEGGLVRYPEFALPGFQNIVIAPLIAIGTVVLGLRFLTMLRSSRKWIGFAFVAILAVNAAMWASVWFPHVQQNWLLVPKSSAQELAQVRQQISGSDEVVASDGIVGGFSDRKYVYELVTNTGTVPVKSRRIWFVYTPKIGIESAQVGQTSAVVRSLLRLRGMRLMVSRQDVWALRWDVPAGVTQLTIGRSAATTSRTPSNSLASPSTAVGTRSWLAALSLADVVPVSYSVAAWTVPGAAGRVVRSGGVDDWHVINNGRVGYVVDGAYWVEPPGHYSASVTLRAAASAIVEAWDVTSGKLLDRQVVTGTPARGGVAALTIKIAKLAPQPLYQGWGIWRMVPVPAQRGDTIELRVWTRARAGQVKVFKLSLG